MKRRVVVLPRAQRDLAEIFEFIALTQGQPRVAQRWLDGIETAIRSLATRAGAGKTVPEAVWFGQDVQLRQVLFHDHRIIYGS